MKYLMNTKPISRYQIGNRSFEVIRNRLMKKLLPLQILQIFKLARVTGVFPGCVGDPVGTFWIFTVNVLVSIDSFVIHRSRGRLWLGWNVDLSGSRFIYEIFRLSRLGSGCLFFRFPFSKMWFFVFRNEIFSEQYIADIRSRRNFAFEPLTRFLWQR